LIAAVARVAILPEPLIRYRQHQGQQIGATELKITSRAALLRSALAEAFKDPYAYLVKWDDDFLSYADRYRLVCERLEGSPYHVHPRVLSHCRSKVRHLTRRAQMSQRPLWRVPMVLAELLTGRYHRWTGSGSRAAVLGGRKPRTSRGPRHMTREERPPLVAVLVLNWNRCDDTIACLESVAKLTYPRFTTVVIDNGSTDGSPCVLRDRFPHVEVIETGQNLGYAGGNNVGISWALRRGADYVLILNNDTIVTPEALTELMRVAGRDAAIGIAGPKVLCEPERHLLYSCGESQSLWFNRRRIATGQPDQETGKEPRDVDYVVGCALLVSREFIARVGMLDEVFFAYYDEVDWCFRGRRLGYRVVCVPSAVVYHKGEGSSGKGLNPITAYYRTRNWVYFVRKHASAYHWLVFAPVFAAVFFSRLAAGLIRADRAVVGSLFRAVWWQVSPESAFGRISPAVMQGPGRGLRPEHFG
jgi:GT2 family glycosyltransferase